MNYLKRLLDGEKVEWKTLGEVAEFQRGTTITKRTAKQGEYPVISGGQKPAYYIDQYNREGETITIAGSGAYAGFVMFWEEPIFVSDAFSIKAGDQLLPRYLFYFLLNIQGKIFQLKKGSGIPHVYAKDVACFPIPIPSLRVQTRIVEILDKFTKLEAELEAELVCRKRQYEYYRNKLLSPKYLEGNGNNISWKTLGEVAEVSDGFPIAAKEILTNGSYAVVKIRNIQNGEIVELPNYLSVLPTKVKPNQILSGGEILVALSGATVGKTGYNVLQNAIVNQRISIIRNREEMIDNGFLKHLLVNSTFESYCNKLGTGPQKNLSKSSLLDFPIPIPPLSEQRRIVAILDKFDTLTHSISEGLPKEIALRRQQYEYYRNELLNFPKG